MKKIAFAFLLACSALGPAKALTLGDIAIVGFASDAPDGLWFVNLVDISAGTTINFTQNGYDGFSFRVNESGDDTSFVYSTNTPAGTIHSITWAGLSDSGDNVFIYEGALSVNTLIYGLHTGIPAWDDAEGSSNSTALPPTLTLGTTAFTADGTEQQDNGYFDIGTLASGTKSEWLAAIGNTANWTFSGPRPLDELYPNGTISVVPEPGAVALVAIGLGFACFAVRRRLRS